MIRSKMFFIAACSGMAMATAPAFATHVNFSTQALTGAIADTIVLNDGVLAAVDLFDDTDSTINGVTFKAGGASGTGSITDNGITIAYNAPVIDSFATTASYSTALENVMETALSSTGNGVAWQITISGLDSVSDYRVQFLGDSRPGEHRSNQLSSGDSTSDVYFLGSLNGANPGHGGVSVLANFTASSSSIVFNVEPVSFQRSKISAVVVSLVVPEPTSLILAGLGLIMVSVRRKI